MKLPVTLARVVFLALLLLPLLARAVSFDLTGLQLRNGGKITLSSTATLPVAPLYKVTISASGTATGTFAQAVGAGPFDLRTALTQLIGAQFADNMLNISLANLPDKLPATLATGVGFQFFPVSISGTAATAEGKASISLKLDKNGKIMGTASGLSFVFFKARKPVKFTGMLAALSGTLTVQASGASQSNAQPDIMIMANPHVVIGNDVYSTSAPGSATPFASRVSAGKSHTDTFLVQNDGPATDSFLLKSGTLPANISFQAFDGKTDITSLVKGAGYPISNLPSGALKAIRVKITVGKAAPRFSQYYVSFSASRASDSSSIDWASSFLFVP